MPYTTSSRHPLSTRAGTLSIFHALYNSLRPQVSSFDPSPGYTMLRNAFTARSLKNCRDLLKVTWGDGVQSTFPNTWLRASVRDSKYFEPVSLVYRPEHLSFVASGSPITSVELTEDKDIKVSWEDHTSVFNSSWLRAQDVPASLKFRKPFEEVRWGGGVNIPRYDHAVFSGRSTVHDYHSVAS